MTFLQTKKSPARISTVNKHLKTLHNMETPRFSESVSTMSEHVKEYVDLRIDLLKLILVEKLSRLTSLLLLLILILVILLFGGVFFGLAFVLWYGQHAGPMWAGALIVTGGLILTGILLLVFRKKLLLNPVVSQLSKIIMEEEGDEREE